VFLLVEKEIFDSKNSNCITFKLNGALAVRVYRDNKPCCLETALLQKGLVLVHNGKELIEEGIGFGVPVVKYLDKTLFSRTAQIVTGNEHSIEKHFLLDTISTKRLHKTRVNDNFYEAIHKLFEKAYLGHQTMQPLNNKIMELRDLLKIKTEFQSVKPRGLVKIKYTLLDDAVEVSADFSGLTALEDCIELLVLNEQGANSFGCYRDTDGLRLFDGRIGAWDLVSAKTASLTNRAGDLGFSLKPESSTKLFRGWEKTKNRFSWAGLSYSIPPGKNRFDYVVRLFC
jgi:hypothetical protein